MIDRRYRLCYGLFARMAAILLLFSSISMSLRAQTEPPVPSALQQDSAEKYLDPVGGKTVDDLVKTALENNGELIAMRNEAEAGESLIRQAHLRANPSVDITGNRQLGGTDNTFQIQGSQPLELGGRRSSRIAEANAELEIRKQAAAERERQLAGEVRTKFGETLAAAQKLSFVEAMLEMEKQSFEVVSAKVNDGRTAPLEQNMEAVELNKMRAEREMAEGAVEQRMFELKNLAGMSPDDLIKLKGDFDAMLGQPPPQDIAATNALETRPDLAGARAVEQLAAARVEQAKAEGRVDADVMLGYQRMHSGFPLLGIEPATDALLPIDSKFRYFTFGVRLNMPVWNKNQSAVAAATSEADAARSRREFGELTVKREIAAAYARYNRATRAMEIYRVGVREQAAQNLDVVRQTYDLGSKTLLDYIAEHHRFMETEKGYIDAELEAYLARVEILRAVCAPELINK
ncbi:MAG TPA: TolC family protein [Pyrinomonadaceae bacterium]